MKKLHHHIFSNTSCISKETMLKYINKQLSKKELHEVEKHMLDCELCSDAFAGMQYAQNSSVLFAIDNAIDHRALGGVNKVPIMRRIMVAAGVLILLFGTYFSVNYFNDALNTGAKLAIIEEEEMALDLMPLEAAVELENSELNDAENTIGNTAVEFTIAEAAPLVENKVNAAVNIPGPNEAISIEEEAIEVLSDYLVVDEVKLEEDQAAYFEEDLSQELTVDQFIAAPNEELDQDTEVVESITSSKKRNKTSRKKRMIAAKSAPMMRVASAKTTALEDMEQDNIIIIEDHKVSDYREEYEAEEAKNKADNYVTESVSAGYERKADQDEADKKLQETRLEVTYQETLEKAMNLFKNEKYRSAISEFDMILAKHPEDVNAQFYMGLSYYHLGQNKNALNKFDQVLKNKITSFNEEASWYKALTLIQMKSATAAKKILKTIVKFDGFYKVKAEERLKILK